MGRYEYTTTSFRSILLFFCFCPMVLSLLSQNQTNTMITLSQLLNVSVPWNSTKEPNPCLWMGVTCDPSSSSVIKITLSGYSLTSSEFLSVLCQIETLEHLDVSNNHLSSIPDGFITECRKNKGLKLLNFARNMLQGVLPTFHGFDGLESLDMSFNHLGGSIGLELDELISLKSLNLSFNSFNGSLPTNLGKSMVLEQLLLSANHFNGAIPDGILSYENLTVIDLSKNKLNGTIPIQIGQLQKLLTLNLSWNSLDGSIPSVMSSLSNLTLLDLQQNNLNGSIPTSIGNLRSLLELQLGKNQLSGVIPSMPLSLQIALNLRSNLFSGPIPSSFGYLTSLEVLDLSNNTFSGEIPRDLVKMSALTQLLLSNNQLSGVIPEFGPHVLVESSGNKNLVNITGQDNTTPNPAPRSAKKGISLAVAVVIAIAAAMFFDGFVTLLVVSVSRHYYRVNDEHLHSGT